MTSPPTTKLAIAIDLDQLSALLDEYVDSQELELTDALTLSMFLIWLKKRRQETSDELTKRITHLRAVAPTD